LCAHARVCVCVCGASDGGCDVGGVLGTPDSAAAGLRLGEPDGSTVGESDGCRELYIAALVGASDGTSDGATDGTRLGVPVGRALGASDGGCDVGGVVGAEFTAENKPLERYVSVCARARKCVCVRVSLCA